MFEKFFPCKLSNSFFLKERNFSYCVPTIPVCIGLKFELGFLARLPIVAKFFLCKVNQLLA